MSLLVLPDDIMSHRSLRLPNGKPFPKAENPGNALQDARRSYERAVTLGLSYSARSQCDISMGFLLFSFAGLTAADVQNLSQKFWDLYCGPAVIIDGAAMTLLTIHYNQVCGTISHLCPEREDLQKELDDLLKFRKM